MKKILQILTITLLISSASYAFALDYKYTLRPGMENSDVTDLQSELVNNGFQLKVDGKYGPATQSAVAQLQRQNGLIDDGIAGKNTFSAFRDSNLVDVSSEISISLSNTPEVETHIVSDVSEEEATLNGELTDINHYDDVNLTFLFRPISEGMLESQIDLLMFQLAQLQYQSNVNDYFNGAEKLIAISNVNDEQDFSYVVEDLDENTLYIYSACAEYQLGNITKAICGDSLNFTTGNDYSETIDVSTKPVTNIGNTYATLRGEVEEGFSLTVKFALSDTPTVNCSYSELINVSGTYDAGDNFETTLNNLGSGVNFYYRSCGYKNGEIAQGEIRTFTTGTIENNPEVETDSPTHINEDSARLHGSVDMNDAPYPGIAFFVWGQDEDLIEDVDSEFYSYADIDEEDEDLQKQYVNSSFEGSDEISLLVTNLDEQTDYYYRACVSYAISDSQVELVCGDVEEFETSDEGQCTIYDVYPEHSEYYTGEVIEVSWEFNDADCTTEQQNTEVYMALRSTINSTGQGFDSVGTHVAEDEDGEWEIPDSYSEGYYYVHVYTTENNIEEGWSNYTVYVHSSNSNFEIPDVETDSATDIDDDSAELRGDVDMNDYDGGRVFFVWGQDEDDVEDVEEEDSYSDIDESGDDLQKESVDNDFDGNDSFELNIYNLDDNTDYYFRICVEYEDNGNNDTLECGDVEDFETHYHNNYFAPEVSTKNVYENQGQLGANFALIRGEFEEDAYDNIGIQPSFTYNQNYNVSNNILSGYVYNLTSQNSFQESDNFNHTLYGLTPLTKYYYQACAIALSTGNKRCGDVKAFKTKKGKISISLSDQFSIQ